ncbi:tail fiber protein [Paenibacillus melissococcoides]|uniref:Tail fiber protein n=1 Tax=Paenibacillus melissococcoides TaxID=2912268 RepID=A0ABN8U6S8_9BACL|nr:MULTISPECIES: tail fiber protein [Paenibacillus]MEB9893270.1 tail fiber protein [Bacillus cereus]CAH8246057.1 tail fiber protein [Paenibacillus melissococcoides]CAH8712847.1 tail fiber protein [Paenibacillus melissococcoides]CAH8713613.1 tail fiber protein [Paenibacillus melissococcoides]GIO78749.1 hypothetical protein J6TS7_23590 [Paenibacillus dendritiformis]
MSSFTKGLTNKGISLQAKAQAGAELKYTKIVLGDGYLAGQSIAALTNVISPKKTADIARLKMTPPNQARIGFILSNQDITTGFYFRELGLYALDPDEGEILYWYGNAGDTADYIPPKGGNDVIAKNFDALVLVGQAQNVTAIINESLVYATHDDVAEALQEARKYTDEQNNARILAPKAFTAEDSGDAYPKGVSMFYLDADGMQSGWPFNNGQVLTFVTGKNRVSQLVFETNIATQRIWTRRWSSSQKAWSEFLQIETTTGSAEKVVQALEEAKAYTDDKTSNIDAPVKAVNGKTGDVVLTADDVGAAPKDHKHDASDINSGTIAAARLPSATTGAKGIVQLSDAVNSTSTTLAATTNAVKKAYDEALAAKQSGVDAKQQTVDAINSKGGNASTNDSWASLAAAIRGIRQATGSLDVSSTFLRNFRYDYASSNGPEYGKKGFINTKNNFLFYKTYYEHPYYKPHLIEVTPSGTIVSSIKLGPDFPYYMGTWRSPGVVGDDIVVYGREMPGNEYTLYAYTHNGTQIAVVEPVNIDTVAYVADACKDGSNTFLLYYKSPSGGPTEIRTVTQTVLYQVDNSPNGLASFGASAFLSKTKIMLTLYNTSEVFGEIVMLTRNGTTFSAARSGVGTGLDYPATLLAMYAYR